MTHNEKKQWIMKKIKEARRANEERKTFIYEELQATLEDEYEETFADNTLIRLLENALDELVN